MKTIAYMKVCMLLVLLLCITRTLSSQETGTTIELSDSIYQSTTDSIKKSTFVMDTDSLSASVETRSCVNTFMNQTVSSNISIWGCSNLIAQYITVTNGGYLSLSAPSEVIINGTFDVLLGGALDVGVASAPTPAAFNYLYDASGNRIARQYGSIRSLKSTDRVNDYDTVPDPEMDEEKPDNPIIE